MYEFEKGFPLSHVKEETGTHIAETIWPIGGSLGVERLLKRVRRILTAVLTLEGGERYSLWSHC